MLMYSNEEISRLISENTRLKVEVAELSEILLYREEEMTELRKRMGDAVSLKSQLDMKENEIWGMEEKAEKSSRESKAAILREKELEEEFRETIPVYHQYQDMKSRWMQARLQLEDMTIQLEQITNKYSALLKNTRQFPELESLLENAKLEIEGLRTRLTISEEIVREKPGFRGGE